MLTAALNVEIKLRSQIAPVYSVDAALNLNRKFFVQFLADTRQAARDI